MIKKYDGNLLISPCPTLLVTTKMNDIENVLTVSWAGIASSHPEYITVSINKKRYSYELICNSMKFCANIPNWNLIESVDYCGSYSGRETDKFKECGFHKVYFSDYILIEQCMFSVLCEVEKIIDLGSHSMFIAKVFEKYINIDEEKEINDMLNPIAYCRPYYRKMDDVELGYFGYTKEK